MKKFKILHRFLTFLFASLILFFSVKYVKADGEDDYEALSEARKNLPIQSNSIQGWPEGPQVSAEAAILIDAKSGTILYAKNIDERLFPASTTKILTCVLALENSELDDTVTFSYDAVHAVPWDGSKIGMDAGQTLTMEECLQAILIGSANEVSNAVAEHVGGSMDGFVDMMNARVNELGLTNTHFVNANGLFDENHYTSAYDLSMIAREFFSYEMLAKIARTPKVEFYPTATQPDEITVNSKNLLYEGKKYHYEYLVGSKTGYTDMARQTLVSCAKKDGMELICVVLKEESPYQFTDTITLFEYGFNNFSLVNVKDIEDNFNPDNSDFFNTGTDIFGNSTELLKVNEDAKLILPNEADLTNLKMNLVYETDNQNAVAKVLYTYNGAEVGYSDIMLNSLSTDFFESIYVEDDAPITNVDGKSVFINVKIVLIVIVCIVILITIILLAYTQIKAYRRKKRAEARKKKNKDKDRYYKSSSKRHNFKV